MKSEFIKATRSQLRFESKTHSNMNVEDLWNVNLTGHNSLKQIGALLKEKIDNATENEDEFFTDSVEVSPEDKLRFKIVQYIKDIRTSEVEDAKKLSDKAETDNIRKQKLLRQLNKVDDDELSSLSKEDILKELESL